MNRVKWTLAIAIALTLGSTAAVADEFRPLVEGTDPGQFALVKIGPETISIVDGEVRLTGKPNGYFATKSSHKNYVLRFEWMYERPESLASDAAFRGNSGLLLHIQEPHKVWPPAIEVQLMNADAGNTFGIPPAKFQGKKDAEAQKRAIKPVGQWNAVEVTCKDGSIVATINGIEVARGVGASPDHGPIGWQSEGAPIRFRNLAIKPLD
ncbi:MAG: DUF1080 domain-containing protein [Isosphaeraceae bacterium]